MKLLPLLAAFLSLELFAFAAHAATPADDVLTYHRTIERDGNFITPRLDFARAMKLRPDPHFHAEIRGHVYAQPLFWRNADARGEIFVATEDDTVYALDALSGKTIWTKKLGDPVPLSALPCGNINPLGITGTPVIDPTTGAIYLDAVLRDDNGAPIH